MALYNLVRQTLVEWDRTLPTERKRLLRLVVEVVFLRGSSILAFQPTLAFLPFLRGKKGSCNSGSDGHETTSYNFFYLPLITTLIKEVIQDDQTIRIIKGDFITTIVIPLSQQPDVPYDHLSGEWIQNSEIARPTAIAGHGVLHVRGCVPEYGIRIPRIDN
jgi:hypothetical protein